MSADGTFHALRPLPEPERPERHDAAAARARLEAQELPPTLHDFRASAPHFRVSRELETAVNMALSVGAPLLLTGEPGTGKTQVAWYLGWYFGIDVFSYQVRSTSTSTDVKYDFDAVAYLREAQHPEPDGPDGRRTRTDFLRPRALWLAYDSEAPCVLLIDEIDKAPRDFPNDLLEELDKHQFEHPFEERRIEPRAPRPPVVVITSNVERRLPDAFLRRCIHHHIELTERLLHDAVAARAGDFPSLSEELRHEALRRFLELREVEGLRKKPSTAELLVWLTILSARGTPLAELQNAPLHDLPGLAALLKDHEDRSSLR